ncbi:keratin, type 1 cytoskeletal 11-like isoform X2 [Branchiostoma floridae]|uniref:Keratin, type 1 cytoskeletal 11-like isoform X2 n=1 Tax=Branchiostoma floridae TaxID=7739 RepID=A0A9J7KK36_BRAFL|nr:keratin, type 1 cytoskeletal 11-like isoform X2 [Branchiostoma floridae]
MSRGTGNILSSADILLGNVSGSSWQQTSRSGGGGMISSSYSLGGGGGGGGGGGFGGGRGGGASMALVPAGRSSASFSSSSMSFSAGGGGYGGGGGGGGGISGMWTEEKPTMRGLNDRLSTYLARVRALEQANAALQEQINAASGLGGSDADAYDWQPDLDAAREALLKANLERARVEIERDSYALEVEQWRGKLEREMDLRADLEADINALKREMDEANMAKVDLEGQIEGAKSELEFMKQVHEQEVKELRDRIQGAGAVDIQMGQSSSQDLVAALKAIREEYEEIARKNKEDVERQFEKKAETVKQEASQNVEAASVAKSEVKEMKSQVQGLMAELEALKAMQRSLEEQIADAEMNNAQALESKQLILEQLKQEIARMKGEMSSTLKSYNDMMKTKLALEEEISIYNNLLQGEEGRFDK